MQPSTALIWPTNLPLLNKYQKSDFTSWTVAFYQKLISKLLNPQIGYLNL